MCLTKIKVDDNIFSYYTSRVDVGIKLLRWKNLVQCYMNEDPNVRTAGPMTRCTDARKCFCIFQTSSLFLLCFIKVLYIHIQMHVLFHSIQGQQSIIAIAYINLLKSYFVKFTSYQIMMTFKESLGFLPVSLLLVSPFLFFGSFSASIC